MDTVKQRVIIALVAELAAERCSASEQQRAAEAAKAAVLAIKASTDELLALDGQRVGRYYRLGAAGVGCLVWVSLMCKNLQMTWVFVKPSR